MDRQIHVISAPVRVRVAVSNLVEMTLDPDTARRILLSAVVDISKMSPRIAPELASALDLKVEQIDWVSTSPCAYVWLEIFGRECCHQAILDPRVEGLSIGWIVLKSLDLVVDGDPPSVRRRFEDYMLAYA